MRRFVMVIAVAVTMSALIVPRAYTLGQKKH